MNAPSLNRGSSSWIRHGGWIVVAIGLFASVAPAATVLGISDPRASGLGTNFALAASALALWTWWGLAVRATRGHQGHASAWVGFLGATAGALGALGLALGGLGWIPGRLAASALPMFFIELPLWSLALLLWPKSPRTHGVGAAVFGLDLAILLLAAGLLFWDFQIRPTRGFPARTLTQLSLLSWGFALLCLGLSTLRGSAPELRPAFLLLFGSLAVAFAGTFAVTVLPSLPARLVLVASVLTLLLRLAAADVLRRGWPSPAVDQRAGANGVMWVAVGAAGLIGLRLGIQRPVTGGQALLGGAILLTLLLLARPLLLRREHARRAEGRS